MSASVSHVLTRLIMKSTVSIGVFLAGLSIMGLHWIPEDSMGIRHELRKSQPVECISSGLAFGFPFSCRIDRVSLTGNLVLADYIFDRFYQLHALHAETADGYVVRMFLVFHYTFDFDTLKNVLLKYDGRFPKEFIEYEIRQSATRLMADEHSSVFTDPDRYSQFLENLRITSRHELEKRHIVFTEYTVEKYNNLVPAIQLKNSE